MLLKRRALWKRLYERRVFENGREEKERQTAKKMGGWCDR